MARFGAAILVGALGAIASIGACAIDENGSSSDGGNTIDVVNPIDGGGDRDAPQDVTFDIPDLGVFETESGVPCTCVASVPNGYTVVEYVADQQPTCSKGYATPNNYMENPSAQPSTCTCTCGSTPTSGSCACGADPATFDISSGNGNCTDNTSESLQASAGSCYTTSQSLSPNGNKLNDMLAAPHTTCTAQVTCGAPTKTAIIPDASVEQGRTCTLISGLTSCNGGTCIPNQGAPFAMCVTNNKSDPCPPSFPIAHTVGTGVTDDRACTGACTTCSATNAGSCGTPQLVLYAGDGNCGSQGTTTTLPADNTTCTSVGFGGGQTFDSAKYTISHTGGACAFNGSFGATGTLGLSNTFRVCCR